MTKEKQKILFIRFF